MPEQVNERRIVEEMRKVLRFKDALVLEIGCDAGVRTHELATWCDMLTVVDPDPIQLERVRAWGLSNVVLRQGETDALGVQDSTFDIVVFTLQLKDVPAHKLKKTIDEALRAVKEDGYIVFVDTPLVTGTIATKGDNAHRRAYRAITGHIDLLLLKEFRSEGRWIGVFQPGSSGIR